MTQPLIACCDLGGTKMLVGLVTERGELLAHEKYKIGDRRKPEQVIADLDASLQRLLAQTGHHRTHLIGLGCSATGVVDVETGFIAMNHNMGWVNVSFGEMLWQRLSLPTVVEMDAHAAALGESWVGRARGMRSFSFLIVGTGIGSGLMLNGQIWHGAHSVSGEIGHTVIVPDGPLCGCGKHGCLEALASGLAITRKAEAYMLLGRPTSLKEAGDPVTAEMVVEAARMGDVVAQEILKDVARYLGIGIANIITFFDPEAVVLGGGVVLGAADLLLPDIQESVQKHLNYWAARETPILMSALDNQAGLYGAARAALDRLPSLNRIP